MSTIHNQQGTASTKQPTEDWEIVPNNSSNTNTDSKTNSAFASLINSLPAPSNVTNPSSSCSKKEKDKFSSLDPRKKDSKSETDSGSYGPIIAMVICIGISLIISRKAYS
jgi:hypothetical protein